MRPAVLLTSPACLVDSGAPINRSVSSLLVVPVVLRVARQPPPSPRRPRRRSKLSALLLAAQKGYFSLSHNMFGSCSHKLDAAASGGFGATRPAYFGGFLESFNRAARVGSWLVLQINKPQNVAILVTTLPPQTSSEGNQMCIPLIFPRTRTHASECMCPHRGIPGLLTTIAIRSAHSAPRSSHGTDQSWGQLCACEPAHAGLGSVLLRLTTSGMILCPDHRVLVYPPSSSPPPPPQTTSSSYGIAY